MTMVKQTETQNTKQESHIMQRIVGILFGAVEILLMFRLTFKLLGANIGNAFVSGIYTVSHFFIGFFEGIFTRVAVNGSVAKAVFEPATLIAMVVVAFIAWFILKLMTPRNATRVVRTEKTESADQKNK
jgi:hypothetical protein